MERTRSGRTVKRSSKYLEMEEEYEDEPTNRSEDEDGDFNYEDNNSDDESFEDNLNYDEENSRNRRSRRTTTKGNNQELTWRDGKLVTVASNNPPIIHPIIEGSRSKQRAPCDIEDTPPQLHAVKEDPGARFYSHVFEALNKPELIPPALATIDSSENINRNLPPLDLINDDQFKLKIETKNQSLIPKTNKANDKIKDIIGLGVNMEEIERYTRVTGYILYNIVSKKKSEIQDSHAYRKIQESWATMPDRNRRDWEIKAKQIKKQIDSKRRNEIIEDSSRKEKRRAALKKAEENIDKAKLKDHNMVDLACYMKTVGEGMRKLSTQIASYQGAVMVPGVESVLLDYLLCTIVPLIGIFEGSEGLDRQTTADSLNKLTFIIPGFN